MVKISDRKLWNDKIWAFYFLEHAEARAVILSLAEALSSPAELERVVSGTG